MGGASDPHMTGALYSHAKKRPVPYRSRPPTEVTYNNTAEQRAPVLVTDWLTWDTTLYVILSDLTLYTREPIAGQQPCDLTKLANHL